MVAYGMKPLAVLQAATAVNADVFRINQTVGRLKPNLLADIIAVEGNPISDISHIRKIKMVMKGGALYK